MSLISENLEERIGRRSLLQISALASASLLGGAFLAGCGGNDDHHHNNDNGGNGGSDSRNDANILNFALNLEYLEAEYYLRAVTGQGLSTADAGGSAAGAVLAPVTANAPLTGNIQEYAREIASDEQNHVKAIRATIQQLGYTPAVRPAIDLRNSFNFLANAAGLGSTFDPFSSETAFLLGAFIFEDVGVTAYKGAAPLIKSAAVLDAAAGILAVEAYHSGSIRTLLVGQGAVSQSNAISDVRESVNPGLNVDQGVGTVDVSYNSTGNTLLQQSSLNLVPTDANSIAFSRTTTQVLNVVYASSSTTPGGFFPSGINPLPTSKG